MSHNDPVILRDQKLFQKTDKAILIGDKLTPLKSVSMRGKVWVPSVFVSDPYPFGEIGSIADVEIPRWVAEQNDLDYEEE